MQRDHNLPVRRSLLDQPQTLGVLPTYRFWNDRERQRLVMPLVAVIAVPVTPLLFLLVAQFEVSVGFLLAVSAMYPYLVMGIVERHIRKELRRRALGPGVATPSPSPLSATAPDRALPVTLAGVCLVLAALALFNVDKAVMLVALALGAAVSVPAAVLPRTRKIAGQLDKAKMAALPSGSRDAG